MKDCEEKLSAKEEQLATAEAKAATAVSALRQHREANRVLDELEGGLPVIDWGDRLREYLALHRKQKDAERTVKDVEASLRPWVLWLVENGNRPTNQRILAYLTSQVDLSRLSY